MYSTRRQFIARPFIAPLAAAALFAQSNAKTLGVRYRTDPEKLLPFLPPPLEPAEPIVHVDYSVSPDAGWARVLIQARFEGEIGWLPIGLWTSDESARWRAREGLGLPVNTGVIEISEGRASLAVAGQTLHQLDFAAAGEEADVEAPRKLFVFDYRLNPDWRSDAIERPTVGFGVVELPKADQSIEKLDPAETKFAWLRRSEAQLPVVELLKAWTSSGSSSAVGKTQERKRVASEQFSPWTFQRYSGPAPRSPEALAAYGQRPELRIEPLEIVEVEAYIHPQTHATLLPPPCQAFSRPKIKLLGIRASRAKPHPFTEVWLLASCLAGRRAGWYAVSHIVSAGGDLTLGRETFGYPTKTGEPEVFVSPFEFSLLCERRGREIAYADGGNTGFSTGTSLMQMSLFCLQADRNGEEGLLILQPWHYQGLRRRPDRRSITLSLTTPDSEDAGHDRWDRLGPVQVSGAATFESAVMQRSPGEVIADVPNAWRYYRERSDGVLPWEDKPGGGVRSS